MLLLLLLSACAGVGRSFQYYEETYGSTHRIHVPRRTQTIEFLPQYEAVKTVVWERDDPKVIQKERSKVVGSYYVIQNVTQKDSGRYLLKDVDQTILVWHNLEVKAKTLEYSLSSGETFTVSSALEDIHCNIYFYPESDGEKQTIVYRGRQDISSLQYGQTLCSELTFNKPCELYCSGVERLSDGRFEFRDHNGNQAVVMHLEVEPSFHEKPYFAASIAALVLTILGSCVKICCCGKSSSKKKNSEDNDELAANNEPAVYHEYDQEPIGRMREPNHQPSGTLYPAQPSVPLIHNPPTTVQSYSENHSEPVGPSTEPLSQPSGTFYSAQPSVPLIPPTAEPPSYSELMSGGDALTFPLTTGPDQRFEVKGMTFDLVPPLSSDTAEPSVYTSEKLNFL